MRRAAVAAAVASCLLSGCATSRGPEYVWQGMNAIDAAQTLEIAKHPACYREADPLTSALVGEHPSQAEVAAVMLAYAYGHARVSSWLDDKSDSEQWGLWKTARIVWHAVGIVTKGATIAHNHGIGLRPGGTQCNATE